MKDQTIHRRKNINNDEHAEISKAESYREISETRHDPSKHQQTAKSIDKLIKRIKQSN